MRSPFATFAAVALGALAVQAQSSSPTSSAQTSSSPSAGRSASSSASSSVASVSGASSASLPSASSNYTLPAPAASATLPPDFQVQQSTPFVFVDVNPDDLPKVAYSLLNETTQERQTICDKQTSFCARAGCADPEAKVKENFCNVDTMGTACRCTKGASNLDQWKWPVQFADCLRRGTTCRQACTLPGGTTPERTACRNACTSAFGSTCGFPNQYGANYAVSNVNSKPKLAMIQGGSAAGAMSLRAAAGAVAGAGLLTTLVLLS